MSGGFGKGDRVRVGTGPRRGKTGEVMRVMRFPRESDSSAMILVRFADGGEGYQVAANLTKLEDAQGGRKK